MTKPISIITLFALTMLMSACSTGPYDPAAHHHADTSTGSMLSGTDAGTNPNGSFGDPGIRSNAGGNVGH